MSDLGRLDEAAAAYEESIRRTEKLGDKRQGAVNKVQFGTVRLRQQRYADALASYIEAHDVFTTLSEPSQVAITWHQIGMVHKEAGQFDQAEQAYRQSLAMRVQQKNPADEADSLGELGNLYDDMGRLEEAVIFSRQAAEIYVKLQNLAREGFTCNNLANTLTKLQRYDEARRELLRAVECDKPYGHAAEPWKTWDILHDLERATGNLQAAHEAWQQAVQSYLAYRRDGGENHNPGAKRCAAVAQAIQNSNTAEVEQALAAASGAANTPSWLRVLIPKLQAVLKGNRDPALAADPSLDYDDAAELQLLLERLGA
ncbi:MAG: tetratricopeptide repeat protein [Deltaproteobacteria bacterium]|nr:tetratricopeptide repeat protein [Deltaproteobacteria bacterium]